MTATLETRARPEDFGQYRDGVDVPRDVPRSLLEMARMLKFTPADFGFTTDPKRALAASRNNSTYKDEVKRAKYLFVRAMLELDLVEKFKTNRLGRPIRGSGDLESRWACKRIRVSPAVGLDALENHWVEFTKVFWEEVLPHLEFVDLAKYDGKKDRKTAKEWMNERHEDPVFQERDKWLKKAKEDYERESDAASKINKIKLQTDSLPCTYQEISDLHIGRLKSLCKEYCGDGSGKKDELAMRLADALQIPIPEDFEG